MSLYDPCVDTILIYQSTIKTLFLYAVERITVKVPLQRNQLLIIFCDANQSNPDNQ